ncbi:ROK family transcriptional regulator [Mangrovibrevibacter kandeliae]|uniref:ROK family transcriptional regulator n=1 Tax=Mangrovibrevibacter kandeliae TaxID=2968473 RepID=UPI0021196292|nr:ROK family transcriptional regulator [Aurantimonas sp. CSK15Z-1]MCQ8782945.1 ROK family transcriptional regulator [Aurantimonas sp. CSK15Z-1]
MKTGDPELMREINRFHILNIIRRHGPISRVEICSRGALSSTTVSAITGSMIEDGVIETRPVGGIHEPTRGRPRVMLQLNPAAARVVGIKLGIHKIVAVVSDFRGGVLASLELPLRVARQPVAVVADILDDLVRRVVVDAGLTLKAIDSICATMPGIVEYGTGIVRTSPIFAERDISFGRELSRRVGLKVIVESDVNAATLAQQWFGNCRDLADFVVVSLEQAIGLGVLHEGELFRGSRGLSLDIGGMVIGADAAGRSLRLLDLASEQTILAALEADPAAADAIQVGRGLRHAVSHLGDGNGDVRELVERAGHAVGVSLANIVSLFAPPRIVLVGSLLSLGDLFTKAVGRGFDGAVAPAHGDVTEIVVEPFADALWAQGAAAIALRELYGSPWNTTGPVSAG